MKAICIVCISLGSALILAAVWFVFGWRKSNRAETTGWLSETKHIANYRTKWRFYKHYVDFVYTYRVNGREYEYRNGAGGTKTELPKSQRIIYQNNHPSISCPEGFQNIYTGVAVLVAIVAALCLVLPGLISLLKM